MFRGYLEEFRANQLNMYPNPVSGNQLWVEAASEHRRSSKFFDCEWQISVSIYCYTLQRKSI
jgi:hypothetical protein